MCGIPLVIGTLDLGEAALPDLEELVEPQKEVNDLACTITTATTAENPTQKGPIGPIGPVAV